MHYAPDLTNHWKVDLPWPFWFCYRIWNMRSEDLCAHLHIAPTLRDYLLRKLKKKSHIKTELQIVLLVVQSRENCSLPINCCDWNLLVSKCVVHLLFCIKCKCGEKIKGLFSLYIIFFFISNPFFHSLIFCILLWTFYIFFLLFLVISFSTWNDFPSDFLKLVKSHFISPYYLALISCLWYLLFLFYIVLWNLCSLSLIWNTFWNIK